MRRVLFLFFISASNVFGASCSKDALSSNNKTYFGGMTTELRDCLETVLHPVMHRAAESKDDILSALKQAGGNAWAGDLRKSVSMLNQNPTIRNNLINNVVWGAKIGFRGLVKNGIKKVFGKDGLKVADRSGIFQYVDYDFVGEQRRPKGSNSMTCLDLTAAEGRKAFQDWHKKPSCTKSIHECPLLGHNSRTIMNKMNAFFAHIDEYEKRVGSNYFLNEEVDEVASFFKEVNYRLFEENILHAITGSDEQSGAANDKELKPLIKVLNYLLALPTEMHNPKKHVEKNEDAIKKIISILPEKEQRRIWDTIDMLCFRAENPSFGQSETDSAEYLVFKGKTATGKTYAGTNLLKLLGYTPIQLTFDEAQEGQGNGAVDLKQLAYNDKAKLSGFGEKMLKLNKKGKPISTLNQMCFIDEADEDSANYNVSRLKDQFKNCARPVFPGLGGLSFPGRPGFIFTTNNKKLFTNAAFISRFKQLVFPAMQPESKEKILYDTINEKLEPYPQLSSKYDFKKIVNALVLLAPDVNIKVLKLNADNVIVHFKSKFEGTARFKETFAEFIQRRFLLDQPKATDDWSSSDDEDALNDEQAQKINQKRFDAFAMAEKKDPNFYHLDVPFQVNALREIISNSSSKNIKKEIASLGADQCRKTVLNYKDGKDKSDSNSDSENEFQGANKGKTSTSSGYAESICQKKVAELEKHKKQIVAQKDKKIKFSMLQNRLAAVEGWRSIDLEKKELQALINKEEAAEQQKEASSICTRDNVALKKENEKLKKEIAQLQCQPQRKLAISSSYVMPPIKQKTCYENSECAIL